MHKKQTLKVLVLGCNPSKKGGKSQTLKKLDKWLDFLDLKYVSFCNVSHTYGPVNVKDIDHEYVRSIVGSYKKILTLGVTSSRVLSVMGIQHFGLPHPSGCNRNLNDKSYETQKLINCKKYLSL